MVAQPVKRKKSGKKNKHARRRGRRANNEEPNESPGPAAPSVQAPQVPMIQKAKGYLYPIHGKRPIPRTVEFDALAPNTLHGFLPVVNARKIFLPVPPYLPARRFMIKTTILTYYDDRFLVLHYFDERDNSPINESLMMSATKRIPWKGEIAIIPLGIRVPFLSTSVKHARLNRAVALFMSRHADADVQNKGFPMQIISP